jgi:hypothetical protein
LRAEDGTNRAAFDLSDLAAERASNLRSFRIVFLGIATGFAAILVAFLTLLLTPTAGTMAPIYAPVGVIVGMGFGVAIFVRAFLMASEGAVCIEVGPAGLWTRSRSGATRFAPWSSLAGRAVLLDYEGSGLEKFTRLLWNLRVRNRRPIDLSKPAFEAIESMARQAGLQLDRKQYEMGSWYGRCRAERLTSPSGKSRGAGTPTAQGSSTR